MLIKMSYNVLSHEELENLVDDINSEYKNEAYYILKRSKFSNSASNKDFKELKKKIKNLFERDNLPRKLTKDEIKRIISGLKILPAATKDISENNLKQIKNYLYDNLSKCRFSIKNESNLDDIRDEITNKYYSSLISVGESVGINSALSISETSTQSKLNAIHNAGLKNKSVKANMEKLLEATGEKDKCETIVTHFKDKNLTYEDVIILGKNLLGVTVDKVLLKGYEIKEGLTEEEKKWYERYNNVMNVNFKYTGNKFLRVKLNLERCYEYNIFMSDVIKTIEKNSRNSDLEQTIKCIGSSTFEGIIDIHADIEYIRNSQINKDNLLEINIEDLINIFYNNYLQNNFKNMLIKGIKGIEYFSPGNGINLNQTYSERPLIDYDNDIIKTEEIGRLWYIKINKSYLNEGITYEKYRLYFESAGMEIIEEIEDGFILLIPKILDSYYYDEETKEEKKLYRIEEGRLYNNEDGKLITHINPQSYIQQKLDFYEKKIIRDINYTIKKGDNNLPEIPKLYRYGYYYYAIIEGENILHKIINNNLIDKNYTYPNNVRSVFNLLGIEAARSFFITKYMEKGSDLEKSFNPNTIEVLIDYQTALGVPLPVRHDGMIKTGAGLLSAASLQSPLNYFKQGATFGVEDKIKSFSSSVMSGTICRNGTGFIDVFVDENYLNNKNNKISYKDETKGEKDKIEIDYLLGTNQVSNDIYNDFSIDSEENDIPMNINLQGIKSELTPKQIIPDPPRMEPPVTDLILKEDENILKNDDEFLDFLEDIPDDPGKLLEDFF